MESKPVKTTINMVVTPEFKELLRKRADQQNRSMTSYIEWLVLQDAAKTEPKNRRG
ncbi:MAG: hypothetical protein IPL59_02905 [Candidatus Competibacteraceae bacterium]|nr:hypothetical protein [Candidatus Competibacteraceae bacterium]MBK8750198.1 hypothetical protein [Candidatus Competibacteraceae bacterium]MBK8752084.1 hypothetical protein [Candidatus Competibacteraceae bacterium]